MPELSKGDFVSIRYNEHSTKAATVLETTNDGYAFHDTNGKFILTKAFIDRSGIVIEPLADDNEDESD